MGKLGKAKSDAGHPRRVLDRSLVVLVVVVSLAIGAVIATVALWNPIPSLLQAPASSGEVAVGQREFNDQRLVSLTVELQPAQSLVAPTMGRLTSFDCQIGQIIDSGTSSASIDGIPVVALTTRMPLWRDLKPGNTGADVASFSEELVRLGLLTTSSSTMTTTMVSAYRTLATSLGVPAAALKNPYVPVAQIAWLPAPAVALASCDVAVAAYVSPGQSLAQFEPTIMGARITTDVSRFGGGERVLLVSEVPIAVDETGAVTDSAALAQLATTAAFRQVAHMQGTLMLQGQYVLATTIQVSVVPPSAVVITGGTAGCVIGNGQPMPVTVIGSEFGQTFVSFSGAIPTMVSLAPDRSTTC